MKSMYSDFLLAGGVLSLILGLTLAMVGLILPPVVHALVGDYYVVANVLLFCLFYGVFSGLVLRILLRLKPLPLGEFSMDSPVFTYWKLLTVTYMLGQDALLPFTTVFTKPLVARLFGARIGSDVALGGVIGEPFLVSVGDGAVLGHGSVVAGSVIADGKISLGQVNIGCGATVGVYSVVMGGIEIGARAKLIGGSMMVPGTNIPPDEIWRGNPARKWVGVGGPVAAKAEAGH